jgi:arylsulfatase A-like enzyme
VDYWAPEASATNTTAMLDFLAKPPPTDPESGEPQPFVMLVSTPGGDYTGTLAAGEAPPAFGEPGYYSYYNNGGSIYDPKKIEADAPLRPAQPPSSKKPSYHTKIPVSKDGLFEPFICKNDRFTKTGSGQTKGKLKKGTVFSQAYRKLPAATDAAAESDDYYYRLHASYLQSVTNNVDRLLGLLLAQLEKNPALDSKTAVLASAESGDYAGDFGLVNSWGGGLDDVLTRVPLVARIPGGAKGAVVSKHMHSAWAPPSMILRPVYDMAEYHLPRHAWD